MSRKYGDKIADFDAFKSGMATDQASRDWAYKEMTDMYAKYGGQFVSKEEFDSAWGAMTEEQAAQKKLDEAKAANSEAEKVVEGQKKKEPTPVGSSGSGGSSVDPKIEKTANKAADAAFLQQKEKLAREYPEFAADKSLSPEDWRNAIQYDKELNGLIDVVQSGGTISDVQKLQKKLSQKGDDGERTYNPLLSSTVAHANKVMTGWNWKFVLSQADGAIKNAQKQAEDALKQYQESGASEAQIQKAKQEMDIELKDFADKVKKDANMKILKMGVADPFTNFEAELEIRRESLATADRWLKKAEQFRRIGETEGWSAADGKSSQAEINYNQAVFNAMASHPKAMVLYDTEEYKPHLILNPTPDKMVMYMYMANKKAKNPELSWQDVQKDALYFMNEYLPNLNPYQRQAYMTTMEDDFNRRMVTEDELQVTLNAMGYDLDLTKDRHVANAFMRGLVDMGGQGLKGLATASDPAAAGASINILGGGGVQGSTWGLLNHPKYGFNTLNQASREEWQMQQDLVNGKISRSAYDKWYSEKMKVYGNKGMVNKGIYSGIELMENPRLANKVMQSPLYIAGQSIQDWSKDTYRFKPKFADSFWMTTLPEGGGSLVGFAGVGAMARVMGVSPMVAASVFGSFVNMGQVYDDAIQHGATEQEALQATMTGGIAGGSVEGVEMEVLFNFLTKKIPAGQVLGTIMYRMAVSGVVEGVQEGLTDVINNMTARQIYDFSRDIINDQTIDSISAGFVLGMMLGPLTAIAGGSEEDQKLREEAIDNISRKIDEISEQQDEMPNSSQFVNQTKEEDGIEDAGTGEEESAAPGADEGGTDEAEAGTGENAGEGETGAVEGDGADAADGGAEEKTSENAADEGEAGAGEEATEETSADVDSMAKALKEFGPIEVEEKTGFQFDKWSDNDFKTISEAYHKAKADGSNPELVAAVEELLKTDATEEATADVEKSDPDLEKIDPLITAARNGDIEAQKQLEKFGLPWEQTTTYRFTGQSEIDVLLSGEKVESKREYADAGIDVTSNPKVTTAADSEYRVTFKESFDKNNGLGKVRAKNEEDSNLERGRGYDLNDVAKIERLDENGNVVEVIYSPLAKKETTTPSNQSVEQSTETVEAVEAEEVQPEKVEAPGLTAEGIDSMVAAGIISKKEGLQAKEHLKNPGNRINKAAYDKALAAWKPEEAPAEAKEKVFTYNKDGEIVEAEVIQRGDNTSSVAIDGKHTTRANTEIFATKEEAQKRADAADEAEKAEKPEPSKMNVVDVPIADLNYMREFQNRDSEGDNTYKGVVYSSQSVDKMRAGFDMAKMDPIWLWKNPKDGKLYVLSGHSRSTFFRMQADEGASGFDKIPAKIFEGISKEEALKLAIESNTLASKETDVERSKVYRKMREQGKSKTAILEAAKLAEGANAQKIIDISYLNPTGKIMTALNQFGQSQSDQVENVVQIARWGGKLRAGYEQMTNAHEDELFDFLLKNPRYTNYDQVRAVVDKAVNNLMFDPAQPMNLQRFISKSTYQQEFDADVAEKEKAIKDLEKNIEAKRKRYINEGLDTQSITEMLSNDMALLNKLRTELVQFKQKGEANVKNAENSTIGLFDDLPIQKPEPKETEAPAEWDKNLFKARTYAADLLKADPAMQPYMDKMDWTDLDSIVAGINKYLAKEPVVEPAKADPKKIGLSVRFADNYLGTAKGMKGVIESVNTDGTYNINLGKNAGGQVMRKKNVPADYLEETAFELSDLTKSRDAVIPDKKEAPEETPAEEAQPEPEPDTSKGDKLAELERLGNEKLAAFRKMLKDKGKLGIISDPKKEAEDNAELIEALVELAEIFVQLGYYKFKAWAEKIVSELGEVVREYLEEAWDSYTDQEDAEGNLLKVSEFAALKQKEEPELEVTPEETPVRPQPKSQEDPATSGSTSAGVGGRIVGNGLTGVGTRKNARRGAMLIETGDIDLGTPEKRRAANLKAEQIIEAVESGEKVELTADDVRALMAYSGRGNISSYSTGTEYEHYTPLEVYQRVYGVLSDMGFLDKVGSILIPGVGMGRELMAMPASLHDKMDSGDLETVIVDLPQSVGLKVAKLLFPKTRAFAQYKDPVTRVSTPGLMGFKKAHGDKKFDLIITNVPFDANARMSDMALHDGFIAESLDLLAPGGYGVFIAPTGVADKVKGAQSIFATKADVVTAIRLPSNTFKDSASTTVDADLLIFRKPTNTEAVISGFVNELGRDLPAVAVAQDVINTSDSALARKMVEGKFNVTNYKKFQSLAVKLNMAEEELFPIVSTFAKLRQNREDFLKSEVRRVPLAYHEPNSQEWFRKANVFLKGLVERKGDERLKRAFFEQGEGQIISMDAIVPLWDLIQEDIKSKITETVTAADATNINPAYSLIAGTWQVEDILGPLSTAIQHLIHGLVNYDISNRILEGKSTKPHIITNLNQLIEGQHLTPHHTFRGPKVFGSEIDMGPESTRLQEMQEMRFMPDSELNKKVHIKKVGDFMVKPADNVQPGTHIVIHGEHRFDELLDEVHGDVLGRKSNVTPDRLTNMLYAGFEKEFGADSAKKLRGVKGSISIEGLMANSDYRVTKKKQSRKEKLGESFEQMRRKQIMTMLKGVTDNLNQQVKMANYIEAVLGSVTGSFYKEVAGTPELMDLLQTVDKILEYRDRANNNQLSDHEQSIARKAAVGELQEFILRNGLESLSKSDLVKQLAATDEFKADARSYAITSIANLVEDEDGKLMKPDFWEGLFGDKKVRYDEQQEFTSAVDLTNTIASREGLPKSFAVDHLIERIRASKLRLNPELAERLNDEYEFTKALTATGEYMMDVTRRDALHVMATEDFAVGNIIEKIAFATEALDQMIGEGVDPINLDAAVAKLNELRASIPPIELKDVSLDPNAGVVHSLPDIIYGFADLMMGGDMRSAIVQKQIGSTVRWEFIGQSDNNLITEALSANGKSITRGMFARWMNRTDEVKPMEGPQQGTFVGTDGKITSDPEKAKKIPDPETTTERNRVLTEKFNEFVKDHGLADQVKENYNNQFAYYEKKHSTGEMELRGLSKTFNGKPLKINPWQWKAVHHYMEYGRSFFNHAVGAGKTMTAVLAAKAKMDKGLSKTAGFLVPLKTVQQWQDTWQQLFPDLRVVVVTSQNREQLFSDISFGGADVVIMPGSIIAPSRATLSPDKLVEYMHQDLEPFYDAQTNLTAAMNHAELAGDKAAVKKYKKLVNDNQRKINSKLKVIESIMERSSGQVQTTLDSIGIDQLIVDEADVFKNLETPLGDFSDIKGISTSSSGPAEIVRYWTRYTQDQTNYNNIAYLTATPVSNSAVELYQSMNAIIPDSLESAGIRSLDDFLTEFADVISEEMAGQNGKMQIKKVFAGVKNTVALRRLMKQCYDVISQEQMDEQMLAQGKHLPKAVPMEHTLPASSARTMANYLQMGWAQIVKDKAKRSPAEKKAEQVMMQYVKDRMNNIDATLKKAAKENWAKKDIDELKEEYRKLDVYRKKESFGVLSLYNQMRVGIASTKYFSKFLDDSNSPSGKLKYAAKQAADSFMRGRGIIESGQYESVETDEFGNRFVYIGNNEETGMPMYRSIDGGQIFFADRLRSADLPKQSISNDFFAALKEELSARGVEVDDRWFGTIDKSTSKSLSEAQVSKYLSKYIEDADQLKDAVNFIMTEAAESIEIQKDEQGFDVYDEDGNPVYDIESGKPTLRNTIKYLYNTGRIKFLFGSTEAMGVGMNLQYNTTDIHHIDMPQRPRDYVQRNGRSVRQGNKNFDVNVHSYTTQGGPEIIMLQLLKVKDRFISSLFNFNDEETSSDTGEVGDDKMSVLTKQLENLISNTTDTRVSGYVQLKKQLDRTVQGIKDARRATETLSTAFGEAEKLTQNLAVKQKRIQILESVRDWFNQKIDQQEANDKGFKKAYQEWESQNGRKERLTQLNKDLDSGLIDLEKYKDERTKLMETAPKREMVEITAEDMQQLIDDYQMPDFTPSLVSNLAYELLYPGELNTVSYTQNSSEVVRGNKELQSLFSKGYKHKRIVGEKEWGESPEPTQRMTTTIQRLRNLVSRDLGSSKNEIPGVEKRLEYAKRMISGDIQAKVQALVDKLGKDDMILDKDLGPFAEKATEPQSTLYDQLEQLKKKEAADRPLFEAFIERQMQYSLSAVYHIESVFPDHSPEKVNDLVEAWVRNMFQHDKMVTEAQGEPVPEMPFLKADGEGPGAEVVTQEEVEGILGLKGVDYTEAGSTEDLDDDDGAADIWASEAEDINNEETRATYGSGENYENPTYNTGDVEIEGEVEGEKTTLPTEAALESVINRIRKLYPSLDIVVTDAIPEGANPVFFQNGSMHINPALIDADGMVSQLATMWLAIFRGFNPAGYNQISQIYREENDGADLDESVVFQEIADAVAAGKEPTGFEKVWQWIKNFLAGIFGYFPVDISKMTVKQFANLAARELWTGKGVADIRANGVASALLNTKGAFAKFQRSRLMPSGERFSTEYGPDSVVANMNGLKVRLSDVSRRLIEGMTYQVGGGVRLGYKGLRILGRTHLGHFIESNRQVRIKGNLTAIQTIAQEIGHAYDMAVAKFTDTLYFHVKNDGKVEIEQPGDSGLNPGDMKSLREVNKMNKKLQRAGRTMATYKNVVDANLAAIGKQLIGWDAARVESSKGYSNLDIEGKIKEAIAEFVSEYVVGEHPVPVQSLMFYDMFENQLEMMASQGSPEYRNALRSARVEYQVYKAMPALWRQMTNLNTIKDGDLYSVETKSVMSQWLQKGKNVIGYARKKQLQYEIAMTDDAFVMKHLHYSLKAIGKAPKKESAALKEIQKNINYYIRALYGTYGMANAMLHKPFRRRVVHGIPQLPRSTGERSLHDVISDFNDDGLLNSFESYLMAKRQLVYADRGMLQEDGRAASGEYIQSLREAVADFEALAGRRRAREGAEAVYQFQAHGLQYLVDSGLKTQDEMDRMMILNPFYVPIAADKHVDTAPAEFYGGTSEDLDLRTNDPLRNIKPLDIKDMDKWESPMDMIAKNMVRQIHAANKGLMNWNTVEYLHEIQKMIPDMGDNWIQRVPETDVVMDGYDIHYEDGVEVDRTPRFRRKHVDPSVKEKAVVIRVINKDAYTKGGQKKTGGGTNTLEVVELDEFGQPVLDEDGNEVMTTMQVTKPTYYQVPAELFELINFGHQYNLPIPQLARMAGELLRNGAINMNPVFSFLRNPFRDFSSATYNVESKIPYNAVDLFRALAKNIVDAATTDETMTPLEWLTSASGADLSSSVYGSSFRENIVREAQKGLLRKGWDGANPVGEDFILRRAARWSDSINRHGAFLKLYREGADVRDMVAAFREASGDYAVGGKIPKAVAALYPFMKIQVWFARKARYILTDAAKDPRKLGRFAAVSMMWMGLEMACWVAMQQGFPGEDDKDRERRRTRYRNSQPWLKYVTMGVPLPGGGIMFLPKSTFQMWLGSSMTFALEKAQGADPGFTYKNLRTMMADQHFYISTSKDENGLRYGFYNMVPHVARPVLEGLSNYNTFQRRPIVPYYMDKLDKQAQYYDSTPYVYRQLGLRFDISPLVLQHLVESYTATVGRFAGKVFSAWLFDQVNDYDYSEGSAWRQVVVPNMLSEAYDHLGRNSYPVSKAYDLFDKVETAQSTFDKEYESYLEYVLDSPVRNDQVESQYVASMLKTLKDPYVRLALFFKAKQISTGDKIGINGQWVTDSNLKSIKDSIAAGASLEDIDISLGSSGWLKGSGGVEGVLKNGFAIIKEFQRSPDPEMRAWAKQQEVEITKLFADFYAGVTVELEKMKADENYVPYDDSGLLKGAMLEPLKKLQEQVQRMDDFQVKQHGNNP
ncbi:MAG: hypothetical protein KDB85_04100 [Chitinophagales bacterium]|nr:hypothetical protein [Chitinophagales bacterium]